LIDGPLTIPDNPDYQQYSYTVTAASSTSLLHYVVSNDPDYTQLDDISVTVVPEPCALALLLGGGIGGVCFLRPRRK